jgi:hypothetical protein
MLYPPCPPWAGWYGPWTPPPMHFHPRWSGPTHGFSHIGYYTGDSHYGHVGHQQGRKASGQENQTVRNAKSDHPVSQEAAAPGHQQEQEAPNGSSVDQQRIIQGKIGPRSETSTDDEAKPDVERGPEEVAAEQDKVPGAKTEARTEAGTSSQWPPNRAVRFPNRTIRFRQSRDRSKRRGLPRPGQLQLLVGVLQDSRTARGGGSNG